MAMPINLAVLRVMKRREHWDKVRGYLPEASLDTHTKLMIEHYRRYYELHPESTMIDMDIFRSLFFGKWNKNLTEDAVNTYNQLMNRICDDVSLEEQASIRNSLIEQGMVTAVANKIEQWDAGEEVDIIDVLERAVTDAKEKLEIISTCAFATTESLKTKRQSDISYHWPLPLFGKSCRPVQGGDFIIAAGLTDVGKTSLTMMLAIAWSVQTTKPILWFNNEGSKERIQKRMYGMMLGVGAEVINAMIDADTLDAAIFDVYKRKDPIRIYDVHRLNNKQLEDLVKRVHEEEGVGGIVWDMLDNVSFISSAQLSRKDEVLEEKYQWARQLGVIYDFPNIATSQQSYNKEWQKWPDKGELKDSKVGKQGACDMLIFMTQPVEHAKETFRYISAPKNKLSLPEASSIHADARFDKVTGFVYEQE